MRDSVRRSRGDREREFDVHAERIKPGNPVYLSAKRELPATWTFKTREGGLGIVQILGFEDEEPRGVKIRYRMLGKGSK